MQIKYVLVSENLVVVTALRSTHAGRKQYRNIKGTLGNAKPDIRANKTGCSFAYYYSLFRARSVCLNFTTFQNERNPSRRFKPYSVVQLISCSR